MRALIAANIPSVLELVGIYRIDVKFEDVFYVLACKEVSGLLPAKKP